MVMRNQSIVPVFVILSLVTCLSSCMKDDDGINYSPTQGLPNEPGDSIPDNNNPQDTLANFDMQWYADFLGQPSFYGDSTSFVYAYDSVLLAHTFTCVDMLGRQMTIMVENLNPGTHTLNFDTNSISVMQDTLLFNGTVAPTGLINITDTSNHRLTAIFHADLSSFVTSDQILVRNGLLENIPFE